MKFPLLALPMFVCGLTAILYFLPIKGLHLPDVLDIGFALNKFDLAIPGLDLLQPGHPQADGSAVAVNQINRLPDAKQPSRTISDVRAIISAAAQRHRVPESFLKSIVAVESNFDSGAVSSKGAIGLMQLMPATAHEFGAADPTSAEQNVDAGTRYLRRLIEKYRKSPNPLTRVIAAYNAGPAAVDRYRGVPPFPETRGYVTRVLAFFQRFEKERRQSCSRSQRRGAGKGNLLSSTFIAEFGQVLR